MLYPEILTEEQNQLLPLIRAFKRNYYLVGGTAIGLQIGHRRSVDFDLFTHKTVQRKKVKEIDEKRIKDFLSEIAISL